MKAQQRLGLQSVVANNNNNNNVRTQSSAERRIAKEVDLIFRMDTRSLIYETAKLLEMERKIEERVENARMEMNMSDLLTARRKLFTQRQPTPIMILTAAFLDAECHACEKDPPYHGTWNSRKRMLVSSRQDKLLTGQGESYERMRLLNAAVQRGYLGCEPCDTSTPAKFPFNNNPGSGNTADEATQAVPKQTIQQLARLVMNSARWREPVLHNQQQNAICRAASQPANQDVEFNVTFTAPKATAPPPPPPPLFPPEKPQRNRNDAALDNRAKFPMGFTTAMSNVDQKVVTLPRQTSDRVIRSLGFVEDNPLIDRKNNVCFMDDALAELQQMYIERQTAAVTGSDGAISTQNRNMIERYVNELTTKKTVRDKDTDSDNDDEYLDTTSSVHPPCTMRKGSLTSNGTASTETAHSVKSGKFNQCKIS